MREQVAAIPAVTNDSPIESSLSVVIPAYNEADRIVSTTEQVYRYLSDRDWIWEIIVVDDGSEDQTAELVRKYAANHPGVTALSVRHGGKASAVLAGMQHAKNDQVLFSDADLSTPLINIDDFRKRIAEGADIVIGSREGDGSSRLGEPIHRHVMGRVFNGLVRVLLLRDIQDTQCGFKMFTRNALTTITPLLRLYPDGQVVKGARVTAFDVELLVAARRQGLNIETVPVDWSYGDQSKVNAIGDTLHNLADLLTVKWNDLRGLYR